MGRSKETHKYRKIYIIMFDRNGFNYENFKNGLPNAVKGAFTKEFD